MKPFSPSRTTSHAPSTSNVTMGPAGGGRLHEHARQSLPQRGQHRHVDRGEDLREVLTMSEEADARHEPARGDLGLELGTMDAVPEDEHAQVGMLLMQTLDGLEEIGVALARLETRGHRDRDMLRLEPESRRRRARSRSFMSPAER
jgi:hypothetical protein